MKQHDIAIAGCGIAGLCLALLLVRQGHRATIYERFEQARPVGSGLMIQPTGLSVLAALGLAETIVGKGAPVAGLLGLNREGVASLEAHYADLPMAHAFGVGIHRADLFGTLFQAAQQAGIAMETGFGVGRFVQSDDGVYLEDDNGRRSARHDLVADALGLSSPLVPPADALLPYGALWATVDWPSGDSFRPDLLEQRYERAARMVGVLPVGSGKAAFFWSLKADDYAAWQQGGMARWWDDVERLWPQCAVFHDQLREADQLVFARYAHRTSPQSASSGSSRLIHIGDSWHAASPQLGQGANMALLDAYGLARALESGRDWAQVKAHFLQSRQWHVRLYQALTWAFTPPFQSDAAWPAAFRDLLLAPASLIPPGPQLKAHLVAGLAGNPLGRLGLAMPDFTALGKAAQLASSTASRACALPQS